MRGQLGRGEFRRRAMAADIGLLLLCPSTAFRMPHACVTPSDHYIGHFVGRRVVIAGTDARLSSRLPI